MKKKIIDRRIILEKTLRILAENKIIDGFQIQENYDVETVTCTAFIKQRFSQTINGNAR